MKTLPHENSHPCVQKLGVTKKCQWETMVYWAQIINIYFWWKFLHGASFHSFADQPATAKIYLGTRCRVWADWEVAQFFFFLEALLMGTCISSINSMLCQYGYTPMYSIFSAELCYGYGPIWVHSYVQHVFCRISRWKHCMIDWVISCWGQYNHIVTLSRRLQ